MSPLTLSVSTEKRKDSSLPARLIPQTWVGWKKKNSELGDFIETIEG